MARGVRIRKAKHTIAHSSITPGPTSQATVKRRPGRRRSLTSATSRITTTSQSSVASTPSATPGSAATVKAVGSIAISSGDEDEVVAVDESRRVDVRDYFHLPVASCRGPSSFDYKCRHCFKSVAGPKVGTTNLHTHQEKCPMLLEAFKKRSAGVSQAAVNVQRAQLGPLQTLLDGESGKVILPFNKADFLVKVADWIASDALALRIVESSKLRELLTYFNLLAKLCSADTITTTTAAEYERVKDKVISMLQNLDTVVQYAYDAWTDKFRSSEYFGIYASWIDEDFQYREVLLRLIHLNNHDAASRGAALFQLFEDMGLTTKMGSGTADNASVSGAIAKALNNLIFDKHLRDLPARNLLGCMCHVANIAPTEFLKEEGEDKIMSMSTLDGEDLEAADEEWVTEDPAISAEEDLEDEVEPDEEEELEERDADEDQQVDDDDERRKVFMALRRMHDSEETVSLPLKDVATRWNSKYLAIKQAQSLKKYDFDVLPTACCGFEVSFKPSRSKTQKPQVTVHRILPDLNYAIKELERLQALPGVSPARKVPFAAAIAKLKIYFFKFLNNDWVCASYMLDLESRASSLEASLKAYNKDQNGRRMKEVTTWVRKGFGSSCDRRDEQKKSTQWQ
ncbi:hypothetical protein QFC20_006862 [Naganishia adeliensis]|uniref:Uncharacterized protein n=1 Tax=Naganishia adeliensis TaxID=92952 RepID=A0ACC2V7S4_9TREE|nr:hypothetical protein QFC20_006862 [Naganishia adeliensis]